MISRRIVALIRCCTCRGRMKHYNTLHFLLICVLCCCCCCCCRYWCCSLACNYITDLHSSAIATVDRCYLYVCLHFFSSFFMFIFTSGNSCIVRWQHVGICYSCRCRCRCCCCCCCCCPAVIAKLLVARFTHFIAFPINRIFTWLFEKFTFNHFFLWFCLFT